MTTTARFCPTCHEAGQYVPAAKPVVSALCQLHLRDPLAPGRSREASLRPRRRRAGRTSGFAAGAAALAALAAGGAVRHRYAASSPVPPERKFFRCEPKPTGSERVLSRQMLRKAARRVARQARAAAKHGRAVEWLAVVLYALETLRPKGARRADARHNIALTAAVLASVGDFSAGRHCCPGRQVTAALVGRCEKTITRHWAVLVALQVVQVDAEGEWLRAEDRAAVYADAEQRNRWRNAKEFSLLIPAWVRSVTDEQISPYIAQAGGLLRQAVDPEMPNTAQLQDHDMEAVSRSVPPPPSPQLSVFLPVVRTKFSLAAAKRSARRPSQIRPGGRGQSRAAQARPASTKSGPGRSSRSLPSQALILAAQLLADKRFRWLEGAPKYLLASAVRRFAEAGWTVADIDAQIELTLADRGWTWPGRVIAPVAYLAKLLESANPARPPRSLARAAVVRQREELIEQQTQARAESAERAATAVPGTANEELRRLRERKGWNMPGQRSTVHGAAAAEVEAVWPETAQPPAMPAAEHGADRSVASPESQTRPSSDELRDAALRQVDADRAAAEPEHPRSSNPEIARLRERMGWTAPRPRRRP
ncbi:MAG: hypothetical protein HOV83_17395 [Catenulispora sp.]|nr:hypothetical protein [Catenulispora sp.]